VLSRQGCRFLSSGTVGLLDEVAGQAFQDPSHRSFHCAALDAIGKHLEHLVVEQQRVMVQLPEGASECWGWTELTLIRSSIQAELNTSCAW
jgi:hypothetical protein